LSAPTDPAALIAEARQKLEELRVVAEAALTRARAILSGGHALGKPETKALTRATGLARYVADCIQRAAWDPPRKRRRGPPGQNYVFEAWRNHQLNPAQTEHEKHAAELLRTCPIAAMPSSPAIDAWRTQVVNWLGLEGLRRAEIERGRSAPIQWPAARLRGEPVELDDGAEDEGESAKS
jgi:hypothetical protein